MGARVTFLSDSSSASMCHDVGEESASLKASRQGGRMKFKLTKIVYSSGLLAAMVIVAGAGQKFGNH